MPEDQFGNWVPGIVPAPAFPGDSIIGGGGGSGDASQIVSYLVDPNSEVVVPPDLDKEAIAYAKNNDGPSFNWDKVAHVWMT